MAWQDHCFSWRDRLIAARHDDVFNDAKFQVEGVTVTANRRILAMASPVLMACFYGSFANVKIGDKITETGPATARGLRAMIDFIYDEDNYSITDVLEGRQEISEKDDLEKVMELLLVGDKYQIMSLISFCRNILLCHVKFTSKNFSGMSDVMGKFEFLAAEIQILKAKLREFQNAIVDIVIFDCNKYCPITHLPERGNEFQIKFKVNQNALFAFDEQKQNIVFDASPYASITWKPKNGRKEIAEGTKIATTKFYAQSNVEITLEITLGGYDVCGINDLNDEDYDLPRDGKFTNDDFELQIIEVNNIPLEDAFSTDELVPLAVLSFQLLERVVIYGTSDTLGYRTEGQDI